MTDPGLSADRLGSFLAEVRALYALARTASGSVFRDGLLHTLRRAVDHSHAAVNCVHNSGHVSSFSRGFAEENMGPTWLEMAGPEHDLLGRRMLSNIGAASAVNWSDPELQSEAGHAARRFMLHFNVRHALGVALRPEGAYGLTLISLCRREVDAGFSEAEALTLSTLGPHLAEALMINRLRANSTHSMRDDATVPMALATPDRWLVYPNAAFADAWSCMAATDAVLRVPRIPPDWLESTPATPFAHGWQVRCTPVEDGLRAELLPINPSGLMTALTRRESEVASLYRSGYSHKEIGRLLSMAPNTVRGHIGRIFEKLEVNSRTQLRARFEDFAAPPTSGHVPRHDGR
jgi:DNA-binding CsgD family transcriptional regulator